MKTNAPSWSDCPAIDQRWSLPMDYEDRPRNPRQPQVTETCQTQQTRGSGGGSCIVLAEELEGVVLRFEYVDGFGDTHNAVPSISFCSCGRYNVVPYFFVFIPPGALFCLPLRITLGPPLTASIVRVAIMFCRRLFSDFGGIFIPYPGHAFATSCAGNIPLRKMSTFAWFSSEIPL